MMIARETQLDEPNNRIPKKVERNASAAVPQPDVVVDAVRDARIAPQEADRRVPRGAEGAGGALREGEAALPLGQVDRARHQPQPPPQVPTAIAHDGSLSAYLLEPNPDLAHLNNRSAELTLVDSSRRTLFQFNVTGQMSYDPQSVAMSTYQATPRGVLPPWPV